MRIYLAGPYRHEDIVEQESNIRRGRQAAAELIAAGHDVECPWLDRELLQADEDDLSVDDLQRNSLSKLEHWAEAIGLLPGWHHSAGTHAELCAAARRGLAVLRFVDRDTPPAQVNYGWVVEYYAAAGESQRAWNLDAVLDGGPPSTEADAPPDLSGVSSSPGPSHDDAADQPARGPRHDEIAEECQRICRVIQDKNAAYGDSAISPVRVFSDAAPTEQLRVRLDDKLSRLMRGAAAGEDVELDLIGYLVLLRIARRDGEETNDAR